MTAAPKRCEGRPKRLFYACRRAHRSVNELERAISEFLEAHNAHPKPFTWTKSAEQILASIARFAQRTADTQTAQLMSRTTVT